MNDRIEEKVFDAIFDYWLKYGRIDKEMSRAAIKAFKKVLRDH
jgi:hypothetical protein